LIWLFFFSCRRRHTRSKRDWSSDVCSSDLIESRNEMTLSPVDDGTLLTLVITYPSAQVRDSVLATGMTDGMETSYLRLESSMLKIGRASCRERVLESEAGGSVTEQEASMVT